MRRSGLVRRLARVLPALIAVSLLVPAALPPAGARREAITEIQGEVDRLRRQARFAEAVEGARVILERVQADTTAADHEVTDARWQVETLERAARLDETSRRELATTDSLSEVAWEHWGSGRYTEGAEVVRRMLAIERRHLGIENPEVVRSIGYLANFLRFLGEYDEAERLYREVLSARQRLLGSAHPDLALSLNNLASALHAQGRLEDAEPLYREALELARRYRGEEHPDVSKTLQGLARLLAERGDDAGAEHALEEAARVYDAARLRAGRGVRRSTFRLPSPYPMLAARRLALGKGERAWSATEKSFARSLVDLLLTAERRGLSREERAQEDSLKQTLGTLERRLAAYRRAARNDSTGQAAARASAVRDALLAAEADWSTFQREIATKHPVSEG